MLTRHLQFRRFCFSHKFKQQLPVVEQVHLFLVSVSVHYHSNIMYVTQAVAMRAHWHAVPFLQADVSHYRVAQVGIEIRLFDAESPAYRYIMSGTAPFDAQLCYFKATRQRKSKAALLLAEITMGVSPDK